MGRAAALLPHRELSKLLYSLLSAAGVLRHLSFDTGLELTVLYNGRTFRKTEIITGLYPNEKNETDDNLNKVEKSTRTGYYLLKLLRDDVSPLSSSLIEQQHIYPRIRYTEMFLAYAEAANDAWGPKVDGANVGFTAYDVIKAIRERAGLATNEFSLPLDEGDVYLEECAGDQAKMTNLKNYRNFQGYIEEIYSLIPDKEKINYCTSWNFGDDAVHNPEGYAHMDHQVDLGNYRNVWNNSQCWINGDRSSLWKNSWYCIRKCNMGIEKQGTYRHY